MSLLECDTHNENDVQLQLVKTIRSIFKGIFRSQMLSLAAPLRAEQTRMNDALLVVSLGDLLGYPFQSTYYSRLLLVHVLGNISSWRMRLLREKDILDKISD